MLLRLCRRQIQAAEALLKYQPYRRISNKLNGSYISCGFSKGNFITYEYNNHKFQPILRTYCSRNETVTGTLTPIKYEQICNETLDSLSEYFEELIEKASHLQAADVSYSDGVLTVQFGAPHGTYVINRQTPNLQIWLSSPTSGPKRYDFQDGRWVYRHDGVSLHELLNVEIPKIVKQNVNFVSCSYGSENQEAK